jgi:hypothetical protein
MTNFVRVSYNGQSLILQKLVADDLGYKGGESLTEAQFWEAIGANAAAGIAACKLALMQKVGP